MQRSFKVVVSVRDTRGKEREIPLTRLEDSPTSPQRGEVWVVGLMGGTEYRQIQHLSSADLSACRQVGTPTEGEVAA
jgi:hypothetical protein